MEVWYLAGVLLSTPEYSMPGFMGDLFGADDYADGYDMWDDTFVLDSELQTYLFDYIIHKEESSRLTTDSDILNRLKKPFHKIPDSNLVKIAANKQAAITSVKKLGYGYYYYDVVNKIAVHVDPATEIITPVEELNVTYTKGGYSDLRHLEKISMKYFSDHIPTIS